MAALNHEILLSLDKVKQAFKLLDENGDGYLSKYELEDAMGPIGEDVSRGELKKMGGGKAENGGARTVIRSGTKSSFASTRTATA